MLKFGTQVGNPITKTIMRSRMTHVLHASDQELSTSPSNPIKDRFFLNTFNHARMLIFGTQVGNDLTRTMKRSRMTLDPYPPCQ